MTIRVINRTIENDVELLDSPETRKKLDSLSKRGTRFEVRESNGNLIFEPVNQETFYKMLRLVLGYKNFNKEATK